MRAISTMKYPLMLDTLETTDPLPVTPERPSLSQPTTKPAKPTAHILPDANYIRTLLVKPGHARQAPAHRLLRHPNPISRRIGPKRIAHKIKPSRHITHKTLIWMLSQPEPRQHLIRCPERLAQFPPCRRQDHPIIHEPGIKQARAFHGRIEFAQVQRTEKGR